LGGEKLREKIDKQYEAIHKLEKQRETKMRNMEAKKEKARQDKKYKEAEDTQKRATKALKELEDRKKYLEGRVARAKNDNDRAKAQEELTAVKTGIIAN